MQGVSGQLLQQRVRLLEVGGVKALGEPAVDLRQQVTRPLSLPLPLPQPAQAHRHPQFQGLRLLSVGHVERLMKTGFS